MKANQEKFRNVMRELRKIRMRRLLNDLLRILCVKKLKGLFTVDLQVILKNLSG